MKVAAPQVVTIERPSEIFLRRWFGEVPDGTSLNIWTLPDKKSSWWNHIPTQADIHRYVKKGHDVYFGLCLGPQGLGKHNRINASEATAMPGLWTDIDFGHEHHKKTNLPPDIETAVSIVNEAPLRPSIIVNSGHGIHAYWPFKELVLMPTLEDRVKFEEFSHRWHLVLDGIMRKHGYEMDALWDLARVLRVPGTANYKSDPPKPVDTLHMSDESFNPEDFEPFLPEIPEDMKRPKAAITQVGNLMLRSDACYPADKFDVLAENNDNFLLTWNHKRKMKDSSPSAWDMSLALFAARAGWNEQEICDLLIHHRRKYSFDLCLHRPDKYQTTIGRALEATKDDRAITDLSSPPPEGESDAEKRIRVMAILSDTFGVKVTRLEKFNCDPPFYTLATERGNATIGTIDRLMSAKKFQEAMAVATNKRIPDYKGAAWHIISQHLLDSCTIVDMGEESTPGGEVRSMMSEYLPSNKIAADAEIAFKRQAPFFKDGRLHVWVSSIMQWQKMRMSGQMEKRDLVRKMIQAGAESRTIHVKTGQIRTTTYVYAFPVDHYAEWKPKDVS